MKPKTFKQLGSPTAEAEELTSVEAIDEGKLRNAASAARATNDEELDTDAMQDRQPSEPSPLDAQLVGHNIQVRWRSHLSPTLAAPTPTPLHTYIWCEAMVEKVADGTSDTRSERAYKLLLAGPLQQKWPADPHRDEPKSFTWTILHSQKWNKDIRNVR
eukprot:4960139-Pleurochrysis_carterae.AAC.1